MYVFCIYFSAHKSLLLPTRKVPRGGPQANKVKCRVTGSIAIVHSCGNIKFDIIPVQISSVGDAM